MRSLLSYSIIIYILFTMVMNCSLAKFSSEAKNQCSTKICTSENILFYTTSNSFITYSHYQRLAFIATMVTEIQNGICNIIHLFLCGRKMFTWENQQPILLMYVNLSKLSHSNSYCGMLHHAVKYVATAWGIIFWKESNQ